jgi:hypothetical protein
MFGIQFKNRKFSLRGEIVRWENGIQTVRTESSEREFRFIQCMGFSAIECGKCKKHPFAAQGMMWCRPCEHLRVGTKVLMEHKVRYGPQGEILAGYWTGSVII